MKYEDQKKRLIEEVESHFRKLSLETDFQMLFSIAISKINQLERMTEEERLTLIELGESLAETFKRVGDENFFTLAFVAPYLKAIEQQTAVIDAFYAKENVVKADDSLDEEQKELKIQELRRLKEYELERMTQD